MVNNKKNKCENAILTKQIEDFVSYLSVEKNYAENTISSYERDLRVQAASITREPRFIAS